LTHVDAGLDVPVASRELPHFCNKLVLLALLPDVAVRDCGERFLVIEIQERLRIQEEKLVR